MLRQLHPRNVAAALIAAGGLVYLTTLLAKALIGPVSFCVLFATVACVSLIIHLAERLREFSLKDLSVKLTEIKQARKEVEELYSKFDRLQQATMKLDDEEMRALGTSGGRVASMNAVVRYSVGCIKRERVRLSRIFAEAKSPETIAQAIVDDQMDALVFKFNGPEVPLDTPPVSVEERQAKKAAETQKAPLTPPSPASPPPTPR